MSAYTQCFEVCEDFINRSKCIAYANLRMYYIKVYWLIEWLRNFQQYFS